MIFRSVVILSVLALSFQLTGCAQNASKTPGTEAAKVTTAKVCMTCHQPQPNNLRAYFDSVAFKANSFQVKMDDKTEIVKFDKATLKVINGEKTEDADFLKQVKKGHEVRIEFIEKGDTKTASVLSIKQPLKIAPEMLMTTADMAKLVAQGPEKGKYTLIDSRPLPRFQEGTIPTAINLPFPGFDKNVSKLPKEKDRMIIFFCGGVTCQMSPMSAKKAAALGYTNLKVYHEGMPAWSKEHYSVVSPQFMKEAWMDKDIPHVLIDIRSSKEAEKAFIKGAVSIQAKQIKKALASFPKKELKPPVMIYDETSGPKAIQVAQQILAAGYPGVKIISGGLEAWKAAGYPVESGKLTTQVVYVPKPRPGEILPEDFKKVIAEKPAHITILDVRNGDEVANGMIPGAVNVAAEQILDRLAELPKDKEYVTHCATGVRAEMAYHTLKEKGYKVRFLNRAIEVSKEGVPSITN